MKTTITDEMLDFYAQEYLDKRERGELEGVTFNVYLNMNITKIRKAVK